MSHARVRCGACSHPAIHHAGGFGCLFPGCGCGPAAQDLPMAPHAPRPDEWSLFVQTPSLDLPPSGAPRAVREGAVPRQLDRVWRPRG